MLSINLRRFFRQTLSLLLAALLLLLPGMLLSCGTVSKDENSKDSQNKNSEISGNTDGNFVHMTVENYGEIVIELSPSAAPITVANFKKLVSEGFYDGLTFHRVYPGFVIQGGDPKGNGTGSSSETIKGEFSANGVENPISHKRGVISMARGAKDLNSASCQFFIVLSDSASLSLDGYYAAFGEVVEGMDVVDKIAAVEVGLNTVTEEYTMPVEPVVIKSAVLTDSAS